MRPKTIFTDWFHGISDRTSVDIQHKGCHNGPDITVNFQKSVVFAREYVQQALGWVLERYFGVETTSPTVELGGMLVDKLPYSDIVVGEYPMSMIVLHGCCGKGVPVDDRCARVQCIPLDSFCSTRYFGKGLADTCDNPGTVDHI